MLFLTTLITLGVRRFPKPKVMKMHQFVSGSAVVIAGWLMATFVHEESPQQYPQQRRVTPGHAANREPAKSGTLHQNGSNDTAPAQVATLAE